MRIKKPKRTPQPCWTRKQVDQILANSKAPYRDPLTFLADTGCRVGEAKWLTWEDVDFDRGFIHIRPKDGWKPKSGDKRVVPISKRLRKTLQGIPRNGRWVFSRRVSKRSPDFGKQLSDRRLLANLKLILSSLGLKGHLHTFRHSFISFVANGGTPERILRKWIGHVDREILDWYYHLSDEQSKQAMQRLSESDQSPKPDENKSETDSDSAQNQHKPQEPKNEEDANYESSTSYVNGLRLR